MHGCKKQVILVAVVALAGCSFGPRIQTGMPQVRDVPVLADLSPQESMARARTFLASKHYGLAIELFKAASRDPAFESDSLNGLAIAYDGIGRRDLAERYFQRALAASPADGRTRRNLAALYAASGQEDKRRELLASADRPEFAPAISPAANVQPVADLQRVSLHDEPASLAALETRSPLGATFRPLLVGLSLPAPARDVMVRNVAGPREDGAIVCTSDNGPSLPPTSPASLQIFRVSAGEVFIAAKPNGATCFIEGGQAAEPETVTALRTANKEYLGLVAAYLERLENHSELGGSIAAIWHAAFWSRDNEA